jgi:uncharacterized protein
MTEPIVEELDRDECLRLLATQVVGRLAFAEPGAAPHLLPVNYTMLRESVVFRSAPGTKLRLLVDEPVAFETDCFDPDGRIGWSVTIRGQAYEASDREMEIEDIHLPSFVERQNSRWVRLVPESVTGRRIVRPSSTTEKLGAPGA